MSVQVRDCELLVQVDQAPHDHEGVQLGAGGVHDWVSGGRPDVVPQILVSVQVRDCVPPALQASKAPQLQFGVQTGDDTVMVTDPIAVEFGWSCTVS